MQISVNGMQHFEFSKQPLIFFYFFSSTYPANFSFTYPANFSFLLPPRHIVSEVVLPFFVFNTKSSAGIEF